MYFYSPRLCQRKKRLLYIPGNEKRRSVMKETAFSLPYISSSRKVVFLHKIP